MRNFLNGPLGIVVALLVLAGAGGLWWILNAPADPGRLTHGWYFHNLDTKQLVKMPVETPTPAEGGKLLRAYVFSCQNCRDEKSRFVAFLERYSDDALAAIADGDLDMDKRQARRLAGWEIKPFEGGDWVKATSPEGQKIMDSGRTRCNGQLPKPCDPD